MWMDYLSVPVLDGGPVEQYSYRRVVARGTTGDALGTVPIEGDNRSHHGN